jgi:hypothetical protein
VRLADRRVFQVSMTVMAQDRWRSAVRRFASYSRLPLPLAYVDRLQETSLAVALDLLRHGSDSVAYRYDPSGIEHIRIATGLRRTAILNGKPRGRETLLFTLPSELAALRHRASAALLPIAV